MLRSGFDLVEIARFRAVRARRPRVDDRLFTEAERAYCATKADPVPALAARFAAKEAVGKLLGSGVIDFQEIEIEAGEPPTVRLRGATAMHAGLVGVDEITLSLTHTAGMAGATAVAVTDAMGATSGAAAVATTQTGLGAGSVRASVLTPLSVAERPRGLTAGQMRALDRAAIEEVGIPGPVLMERAALGVAALVLERYPRRHTLIVCGRGNNGGDGLAAARQLHLAGHPVACVVAASGPGDLSPDAATNLAAARGAGVNLRMGDVPAYLWDESELVVDCLLGTGASGPLRPPVDAWAARVNAAASRGIPVMAVDIPSGVDASTGSVAVGTVTADLTVTFHVPKTGILVPPGSEAAGEVLVWDIGLPGFREPDPDVRVVTAADVRVPGRRVDDHKYRAGFVGVVAGSASFPGAAYLAARAAARTGAGYVRLITPAGAATRLRAGSAEAVVREAGAGDAFGVAETGTSGAVEGPGRAVLGAIADGRLHALVVGPGVGRLAETLAVVRRVVLETDLPAVLDADGLLAFAGEPEALRGRPAVVLTPHAGELAALLGCGADEVTREPLAAARRAADLTDQVVVLKGSNTIIALPGGGTRVVVQGPPQLATAGTGDVLSGCMGALLARGMAPGEAAGAAVWLHAEAGRLGARLHPQGLLAQDVIEILPRVIGTRLETRRPGWSS